MLITENIKFAYNEDNQFEFPDIHCEQGSKWLLLGQSGGGKTTLLHLLGGLLRPSSGRITVAGKSVEGLSDSALDHFRGRNIGIVFQRSHLLRALSVEKNLLAAQYFAGLKKDKKAIVEVLEKLNMGHKVSAKSYQLSQGEQQRVAIARALINKPQVILADEPTSSLDDNNCQEVIELLEERALEVNATLLIVTHDTRLKKRFSNQITL